MGIKCPQCQTDNPSDSKYCKECATPLPPSEEILASPTKTLETPVKELTRGTTFAGRYEFIEELGKGGMGRVYKVFDKKIKEDVAVKILKPEIASDETTIERFSNELKLARKIVHKNVGRMYELMEDESTHFITMEYVAGEDLKSFIRRAGQLTVGKAVSIARQVCEGLAEAHKLGVVHRDLKPGNIMIDKEGNARIMDFGIARSLKAEGITTKGVVVGTPEYMSPEQVDGKEADDRSDIYSLGIILYEMLTGQVPFEGDTSFSVALKHKTEMPKDPCTLNAQIPESVSHLILRCMQKEREDRYQSVKEILDELKHIKVDEERTKERRKWFDRVTFRKKDKAKKPQKPQKRILKYSLRAFIVLFAIYAVISVISLINDSVYKGKFEKIEVEHNTYYKNLFPIQKDWLPEEWGIWNCNACNAYKKIFPYTIDKESNWVVDGEYQKTDYVKKFRENPYIERLDEMLDFGYDNVQDLRIFLDDYSKYFKFDDLFEGIKCSSINPYQMIERDQIFFPHPVIIYTKMTALMARLDFIERNYEEGLLKIRNAMIFVLDQSISSHSFVEALGVTTCFKVLCKELIPLLLSGEANSHDRIIKQMERLISLTIEGLDPELAFYKEYLCIAHFCSIYDLDTYDYHIYDKFCYWRDGFSVYRHAYKAAGFYQGLFEGLNYIRNIRDKSVYMKDYYEKHDPSERFLLLPSLDTGPFRLNLARMFGKIVLAILSIKRHGIDSPEFLNLKGSDVFINELSGRKFEILDMEGETFMVLDEDYRLSLNKIDYTKDHKKLIQSLKHFDVGSEEQIRSLFYSFELE